MSRIRSDSPDFFCSSLSSENFHIAAECASSIHKEKKLYENSISMNIDDLYDLIMENSEFMTNFYESLEYLDVVSSDWQVYSGTIRRTKKVAYSFPPSFGSTVRVTNHYTLLDCCVPNELYSVDIETEIDAMKGDCFKVYVHTCLAKITEYESSVFVSGKIVFTKNVWLFKSMIENSTWKGLENYYEKLFSRLQDRIPLTIKKKQSCYESTSNEIRNRVNSSNVVSANVRNNDSMGMMRSGNSSHYSSSESMYTAMNKRKYGNSSSLDQPQSEYQYLAYGLGLVIMIVIWLVFKIKI